MSQPFPGKARIFYPGDRSLTGISNAAIYTEIKKREAAVVENRAPDLDPGAGPPGMDWRREDPDEIEADSPSGSFPIFARDIIGLSHPGVVPELETVCPQAPILAIPPRGNGKFF